MIARIVRRFVPGVAGLVLITGAVLQQGGLTQLGLTEALARELLLDAVERGGTDSKVMSAHSYDRLVQQGRKSFQMLPVGQRSQAATGLFSWAKAHTGSSAFKAAYAKVRAEKKPLPRVWARTIDQEIQQVVDENLAGVAQMKKAAESMSPKEREELLAVIKQSEQQARTGKHLEAMRADKVRERAREEKGFESATKEWEETFPVAPGAFIAKALRAFLEGTAGVDYSAKIVPVQGEGGESLWFENMSYRETKPWMWVEAILAGKQAIDAARAAAAAWLKELGG